MSESTKAAAANAAKALNADKKVKPTESEFLATREKETRKKHRRVIEGSIRRDVDGSHAGKLTVEMVCQAKGCEENRRVATSDLFQVRFCEKCTVELRNKKRRKKAAELKAASEPAVKVAKPKKEKVKKARKSKESVPSFAEANGAAHGNMAELPTTEVEGADQPAVEIAA